MKRKMLLLVIIDIIGINLAYILAFGFNFGIEFGIIYKVVLRQHIFIIIIIKCLTIYLFKLYYSIWEYASIDEMIEIVGATIVANIIAFFYLGAFSIEFPFSFNFMVLIMDMLLLGGTRFIYRITQRAKTKLKTKLFSKGEKQSNVLIIGAGSIGAMVIKELRNREYLHSIPIALIDDDRSKIGRSINGIPVVGNRNDIEKACQLYDIDEIIIAIPAAKGKDIRDIVDKCTRTKCKTVIVPGVHELIDGKINVTKIRDIQIEDLLGREETNLELSNINDYINNKVVLITGGGGSIGSELCRQIAKFKPKEIIIFDIYENGAYDIQNELLAKHGNGLHVSVVIGSIRDKDRLDYIFRIKNIEVIFHAAAHKHVPLMEENPIEAVKNNVFGTLNVVEAANKYRVKRFVLISTDKAVNPTNVMGATKRITEMIIQNANTHSDTEFVAVRFGNVLGSNGSVVSLFKKQIANGGPVTITHPDIIRYFMTISEACQLVLQAGAMANGGEIFILDMGKPVKIIDLAYDLIKLSGLEPEVDIPIKIIGLRPGDKLYEELLIDSKRVDSTKHNRIYIEKPIFYSNNEIQLHLKNLLNVLKMQDDYMIKQALVDIVPEYIPYNGQTIDRESVDIDGLSEVAATGISG